MTKGLLPESNVQDWANKLKAKRNPFLTHSTPNHSVPKELAFALSGAIAAATFNAMVTDKLPSKMHIPAHGTLALATTLIPSHSLSAAIGGAMFYAFMSETYYGFIKSSLLQSVKDAITNK